MDDAFTWEIASPFERPKFKKSEKPIEGWDDLLDKYAENLLQKNSKLGRKTPKRKIMGKKKLTKSILK